MTHDKFCPSTQDDLPLWQPPCMVCEMLVKARADEREQALAPILELARKFESEGEGESLLYTLAAGRIRRAAARGGEQA